MVRRIGANVDVATLAQAVLAGERLAVARPMTLVEREHGGAPGLVTNHHHDEMVVKVLREEEVTFATQPFALSRPQWKISSAQQH